MYKSFLTIGLWVMVLLLGITQGWSGDDIEDRFINPDITTSKTIFIDVKGVSLIDVLKLISQQTGLSFIAAHDVEDRQITLYLNKVPLNQALQTILDAYDLSYQMQEDNNVIVVTKKLITEKTKITKVYQLKYATVSSSKLNTTLTLGSSSSSSGGGLEEAVKDALSQDGKVIEDPRTNSLIITDVPSQFGIIESTISKLDVAVPQILIEVEMLDVSKSLADNLGIKYGANPLTFQGSSKSLNYPFSRTLPTGGGSSSGSGSFTPGSLSASGFTAELNMLITNTDARTLARPRILTLNNETAQIEISTDQAISIQSVQTTVGTGTSSASISPERYTTGVVLKVTPQANLLTREITMAVSPKVIDVILSQVQASTTGASQIFDPETRGSDSILKLKDGQSMVIGGLMTNQYNNTVTKFPILGDIPIIGAGFRSSNRTKAERELIIFLTPHIIDDTDQSALKEGGISPSVQSTMEIQNASDRAQDINNSLNSFDMK